MDIVFILDDDEDILFVLEYWLVNEGYEVHTFTNSNDMMQFLDICTPDIMLVDINLNGEDGREVCMMMRRERNYNSPILHISANSFLYDNVITAYANGFIAKPFDLTELTKVIAFYISNAATPHTSL